MANARLGWFSPLGVAFRFGDCRSAGWPSGSLLPLFGMRRFGVAVRRVGLRAHCFRFSARTASELPFGELVLLPSASEIALGGLAFGLTASAFRRAPLRRLPSAGWPSGSPLPLFGMHRFGDCRWASSFFRLPFRSCRSASWSSDSLLPLFGMRQSAPPHRRSEDRRSTPTRQLFHFKTLIPTC